MHKKLISVVVVITILSASLLLIGAANPVASDKVNSYPSLEIPDQVSVDNKARQSPYIGTEKGLRHWVYNSGLHSASTPVIDSKGTAYFTAEHDMLAVDRTGKKLWTWHCEDALTNDPELGSNGYIYITSEKGILYAISSSGVKIWTFARSAPQYPRTTTTLGSCSSCTISPDGTIYYIICYNLQRGNDPTNNYESILYAVNPDGSLKWSASANKSSLMVGKPLVDNSGRVFFEYISYVISSYRLQLSIQTNVIIDAYSSNGSPLWEQRIQTGGLFKPTPLCPNYENGVLIGAEKTLYSIDSTGQIKKLLECSDAFTDANGIAKTGNNCFAFTSGSSTYCCDAEGALQWMFVSDSNTISCPLTDSKGDIYFSTMEGKLYCLDPQGKEKWISMLTGKVYGSSPAMRSDGIIYEMTSKGDLNAVGKIKVKSVSLNTHEVTLLTTGMKGILKTTYSPEDTMDNAVEWSSSNPAVAIVRDGVITPVSAGRTLIKVYSTPDNISDTCTVIITSKPRNDMILSCDTVLTQNGNYYEGIFTFQNLALKDGITVTSEGISEVELLVKGTLSIGKNASIRVRNGCNPDTPNTPLSTLSLETLKNVITYRGTAVMSIPYLYGKGGNGGAGGVGSYIYDSANLYYRVYSKRGSQHSAGGGGGSGGYGGGIGGKGGDKGMNYTDLYSISGNVLIKSTKNAGTGTDGENNGKNGGNVTDYINVDAKDPKITLPGGEGGGALKTGKTGVTGTCIADGGSGGGGNGGGGGAGLFGSLSSYEATFGLRGGGGGGGGGYGGGVLVIAAGSIQIQNDASSIPCFITSGQKGGKGGYPNGSDGENGEGGLLIIETNSYKPLLSHWNIGTGCVESSYPDKNGGHGTVTGNPQKVFINGMDVSSYTKDELNSVDMNNKANALIIKIGG